MDSSRRDPSRCSTTTGSDCVGAALYRRIVGGMFASRNNAASTCGGVVNAYRPHMFMKNIALTDVTKIHRHPLWIQAYPVLPRTRCWDKV
jgi:hypothetical protein